VDEPAGDLPGAPLGFFLFKRIDQLDGREEPDPLLMMLDGLHADGGCDMGQIAFESTFIGLGFSIIGMLVASAGFIAPVWGALLQEGIDVAVILNALRALR
jgi:hypothetical protein